jgi:hypothetical protein
MRVPCAVALIVLASFVITSSTAQAQEAVEWERFFPFDVGTVWEYSSDTGYLDCNSGPECESDPCAPDNVAEWRVEVIGEEVLGGSTYATVERTASSGGRLTCYVRVTEGGVFDIVGDCWPLDFLYTTWGDVTTDEPYSPRWLPIGADSVFVEGSKVFYSEGDFYRFGAALGRYSASSQQTYTGGDSFCSSTKLVYARVDGVEYGSATLTTDSGEAPAKPRGFAVTTAFPNPFHSDATVTLSLPVPDAVVLEAFDVLGRRVLRRDLGVQPAGETHHAVDGTTLAPGVYFG